MIEFARPTTVSVCRCVPVPTVIVEPTENPRPLVVAGGKHDLAGLCRPVSIVDHEVVERSAGSGAADEGLRAEVLPPLRADTVTSSYGPAAAVTPGRCAVRARLRCAHVRSDRGDDVGAALCRERVVEGSLRVDDERERDDRRGRRDQHDERDDERLQPPSGDPASHGAKDRGRRSSHDLLQVALSRAPAIRPSTSSIVRLA